MKTYDEMVEAVFRRRDAYLITKRTRRRVVVRVVIPVCLACVAGVAGYGAWSYLPRQVTPPSTLEEISSTAGREGFIAPAPTAPLALPSTTSSRTTATGNTDSDELSGKKIFAFNKIVGSASAACRYRDPAQHYDEKWDEDKTAAYLGVDLRRVPEFLSEKMARVGGGEFTVTYRNDGTLVEDVVSYSFEGNAGQQLSLSASRLGVPYDCIYSLETEIATPVRLRSTGEIVSVLVATDGEGLYIGDFAYADVNYRIRVENTSPIIIDRLVRMIAE